VNNLPHVTTNELTPASGSRPKAYSYVRFSTKRQAKGDSLQRQLEKSRRYAAEHDLDLQEATFEDLGVSAFDRSNVTRGALAAFIKTVESGAIEPGSYLLVESLDRLSRSDVLDAMSLLGKLVKLGIRVVTVIDGRVLDEDTVKEPMNVMYAVLVFVRANEESETKAERVKKAHDRKRRSKSTFAFGQGPGWLRPNEARDGWEAIPELVESVQKVFEYTANGYGGTAIARIANREGWPVPARAADWHKTLPGKLVANRRVLGEFEPQVKAGKQRVPTGEVWQSYYPAVVSEALFNQANAAVARRVDLPKRRDLGYHNIFQGMLRCGHCGGTLARKSKNGPKNSLGYALYVCANRDRGVTACPNWNAAKLESALIRPLMTYIAADIQEGGAREKARKELGEERAALLREQKAINHLLTTLETMGGSTAIAGRLRALEASVDARTAKVAKLSALLADPVTHVFEGDLVPAIERALAAVQDVTLAWVDERARLHQALLRVVKELRVWPGSHAAVRLQGDDEHVVLIPFAEAPPQPAFLGSGLRFWQEESPDSGADQVGVEQVVEGCVAS
jgi:DNA invertase Pin-like site-specific DNA recombinase